jgi:hypothetical protein
VFVVLVTDQSPQDTALFVLYMSAIKLHASCGQV